MLDPMSCPPMADKRFLAAFLTPSRIPIEGYRLYPFCIKYRLWLDAIGSPFIAQDKELTIPDLIIALQVCSERPVGRLSLWERWLAFRMARDESRFEEACKAFVGYMDGAEAWPRFYEKKDASSGGGSTIPWLLMVLCNLIRHGISYEHALQMPEARAIWLSTGFALSDGAKIEVLTTDDEELIDSLQKVEADKQCPNP